MREYPMVWLGERVSRGYLSRRENFSNATSLAKDSDTKSSSRSRGQVRHHPLQPVHLLVSLSLSTPRASVAVDTGAPLSLSFNATVRTQQGWKTYDHVLHNPPRRPLQRSLECVLEPRER